MNIFWSIVLLASAVFMIASVYFFGNALVTEHHPEKWYGASAVCLLIAAALTFVQVKKRPGLRGTHAHH